MKFQTVMLFIIFCIIGCKSTEGAMNENARSAKNLTVPAFSDVLGKEWKLTDILIGGKSINFDRKTLLADIGDIFTLTFDAERLNGVGAPNRYFTSYTHGENQALSIRTVASTRMAPIMEPDKLKEHEYFMYIQNTYRWNLKGGKLELFSKTEKGLETVLIFSLQ